MKIVKDGLTIIGNNHLIPLEYKKPEWSKEEELSFKYKGEIYFLSEFMRIENNDKLKEYDGYFSDTFFSGIVIKFIEEKESVKVYRYYS
jgi:hypothetical protein